MSTTVRKTGSVAPPAGPPAPSSGLPWAPPLATGFGGDWPRTNRVLPWLLAAFLVMVWLTPFDSTQAYFDAPIDPKLDRFLIVAITVAWIAGFFSLGPAGSRWRRSPMNIAVLVFLGIAMASIVLNVRVLLQEDELDLAVKKLSLLLSWLVVFIAVATSLRPAELRRFMTLFLGLAAIAAVGVLYQYFTDRNLFYEWWQALVPESVFGVRNPPKAGSPFVDDPVTGPTRHALSLAAMGAMALGIAIVRLLEARTLAQRLVFSGLALLMLGLVFSASRKTGSFASVTVVLALLAYRPRQMMRLVPAALILLMAVFLLRPTAVEQQFRQIDPRTVTDGLSAEGRKNDYRNVEPDVREKFVIGRGYGSYEAQKYRFLDNHYLVLLIETGALGLAAFGALLLTMFAITWRPSRSRDPARAGPALAAAAVTAALGMSMALFDALAFPGPVYLFFFMAGVAVVAQGVPARERRVEPLPPLREPLPPLRESTERDALPPLEQRLERERAAQRPRREVEEHGGRARRAPRQPGRGRPQPIREHVSAPLPGGPPEDGPAERARRAALLAHAARLHAGAMGALRRRSGAAFVGLVALAVGVLAFGRGGSPDDAVPTLGVAGGGGAADPFGLDQFGPPPREGRPGEGGARGGGDPAPRRRTPQTVNVADGDPAAPPTTPVSRPEAGDPDPPRRETPTEPRRPRPPGDEGPGGINPPPAGGGGEPQPEQPPQTPEAEPAGPPDCLPGEDTELLLIRAGLQPCPLDTSTGDRLRAAYEAQRLSREDLDYLVEMLRKAQAQSVADTAL